MLHFRSILENREGVAIVGEWRKISVIEYLFVEIEIFQERESIGSKNFLRISV